MRLDIVWQTHALPPAWSQFLLPNSMLLCISDPDDPFVFCFSFSLVQVHHCLFRIQLYHYSCYLLFHFGVLFFRSGGFLYIVLVRGYCLLVNDHSFLVEVAIAEVRGPVLEHDIHAFGSARPNNDFLKWTSIHDRMWRSRSRALLTLNHHHHYHHDGVVHGFCHTSYRRICKSK